MIKHVVLAKFKSGVTAEQIAELRRSLGALPSKIPEIKGYHFGQDTRPEKTLDFALVSTFEDMAAVKRYLVQPDHAAVGRYIRSLCESLQVIDFEHE
jgi:heme-degrading monooxygenase HmoA